MKSKERIIVEETGCDEEKARACLKENQDNLQKALKEITSTLKCVSVVKGKFFCPQVSIYGLFTMITDLNRQNIIRRAAVVSNNPAIYENILDIKWHIFEKRLYALRLLEGSLQETTSGFEQELNWKIKKNYKQNFYQLVKENNGTEVEKLLAAIIADVFQSEDVKLKLKLEELTLNQFRELSDETVSTIEEKMFDNNQVRGIILDTELIEGNGWDDSVEIEKLKKNSRVLATIIDGRDIAQYLSKLLGGRKRDTIIPLASTVENIDYDGNYFIVDTRFGPGIIGKAMVRKKTRVRIVNSGQEGPFSKSGIVKLALMGSAVVLVAYLMIKVVFLKQ